MTITMSHDKYLWCQIYFCKTSQVMSISLLLGHTINVYSLVFTFVSPLTTKRESIVDQYTMTLLYSITI